MTVEEVLEGVKEIQEIGNGDPEIAHSREDALHVEVLEAIAEGAGNAPELAKAALLTSKLDFSRWCA